MILLIRSFAFNIAFYVAMILWLIALIPTLLLPASVMWAMIRAFSKTARFLLRVIAGIRVEVRHPERLPPRGVLVASKHQSMFETLCLIDYFDDPAFILKRELMWIPVFGWLAAKGRSIPVDRGRGREALRAMAERARKEAAGGRQIVIYPEGTRRAPGAEPAYKTGIMLLYRILGVPIVPMALNAGLFWPRRTFRRHPGTIVVEFLPPIPEALAPDDVFQRMQREIETASDRLLLEAVVATPELPLGPDAAARIAALTQGS